MKALQRVAILLLLGLLVVSTAGAADKWLHVRVEEGDHDGERVHVNVPLSLVERMLPLITVDELSEGKLILAELDGELHGIDLRELAAALADAPDADFVTVESDDEKVRVSKEGEYLIVGVEDRDKRSSEKVRVRIPLAVVDALVGDEPGELDLVAALRRLGEFEDTLIDIQSDGESVRVWIDSNESGQ